ncbi:MAG: hypothetical protein J7K77_01165 [Dehalococcoidales bacterium]|nr:hypothetical protein [Dehalococcoidales bacterium]
MEQTRNRAGDYVTRVELKEYHHGVREFLRRVMRLFRVYEVRAKAMSCREEAESYRRSRRIAEDSWAPEGVDLERHSISLGWWVAAVLLFGFGDSLTSALVFTAGGYEVNPLMILIMNALGNSLWTLTLVKIAILIGLFFLTYYQLPRRGWLVPRILSGVGVCLIIGNLVVLFTAM